MFRQTIMGTYTRIIEVSAIHFSDRQSSQLMHLKGKNSSVWRDRDYIYHETSWAKYWFHGVMGKGMMVALNAWWLIANTFISWITRLLLGMENYTSHCAQSPCILYCCWEMRWSHQSTGTFRRNVCSPVSVHNEEERRQGVGKEGRGVTWRKWAR